MTEKSIFALAITQYENCDKIHSYFAMAKLPLKNVSITLAPPLVLFKQKNKNCGGNYLWVKETRLFKGEILWVI